MHSALKNLPQLNEIEKAQLLPADLTLKFVKKVIHSFNVCMCVVGFLKSVCAWMTDLLEFCIN